MERMYRLFEKNGRYVLVVGEDAIYGLYVYHKLVDKTWILVKKKDPNFDFYFTEISSAKYTELDYFSNIDALPPYPDYPAIDPPHSINDYLQPIYHKEEYPFLHKKLMEIKTGYLKFYPVFYEDLYESLFGDGEFYYLHSVFSSKEIAEQFANKHTSKAERYFYGEIELKINAYEFDYKDILPALLPYTFNDKILLRNLENLLKTEV